MGELKFRAWDVFNADMFPKKIDDDLLVKFFREVNERRNGGNIVHIMQYTGLLDKAGREIYEGDIIDQSKYPDEPCPFVVVFEDGSFRKKYSVWDESLSKPQINEISLSILDEVVIGNIHENPELLKD